MKDCPTSVNGLPILTKQQSDLVNGLSMIRLARLALSYCEMFAFFTQAPSGGGQNGASNSNRVGLFNEAKKVLGNQLQIAHDSFFPSPSTTGNSLWNVNQQKLEWKQVKQLTVYTILRFMCCHKVKHGEQVHIYLFHQYQPSIKFKLHQNITSK